MFDKRNEMEFMSDHFKAQHVLQIHHSLQRGNGVAFTLDFAVNGIPGTFKGQRLPNSKSDDYYRLDGTWTSTRGTLFFTGTWLNHRLHGYGICKDLTQTGNRGLHIGEWSHGAKVKITYYSADGSITNEEFSNNGMVLQTAVVEPMDAWFGSGLPFHVGANILGETLLQMVR